MSQRGPRPHLWKYPDPLEHEQHIAWMRMSAQARFRGEAWDLGFEDFKEIWNPVWHLRGRGRNDYCLTRLDPDLAWTRENTTATPRLQHLRSLRQK
jgi:hypothetical protein